MEIRCGEKSLEGTTLYCSPREVAFASFKVKLHIDVYSVTQDLAVNTDKNRSSTGYGEAPVLPAPTTVVLRFLRLLIQLLYLALVFGRQIVEAVAQCHINMSPDTRLCE